MRPTIAEQRPLRTYTEMVTARTCTPESRATHSLLPTARTRRPKPLSLSTKRADHDEYRQEPNGWRQSADTAVEKPQQHRRSISDWRAVAEDERDALEHASGSERGDNRRNAESSDEHAVEKTDTRTDAQGQRDRPYRRRIGSVGVSCHDDRGESDRPRDRQIEAAGGNDGALTQAENCQKAAEGEQ